MRHQLIIIGSGPAACSAAIYAARGGLNPLVIAGSSSAGGELMTTTDVENFPGFPEGILGPDLMALMTQQGIRFGAEFVYDDVQAAELVGLTKRVTLASGAIHEAPAIIVATGAAHRHLDVAGEARLAAKGVSYCATCDGVFFTGQGVAVVGGGDSAAEEALFLSRFASKVYLIHRRSELRASQIMQERVLANDKIELVLDHTVVEIIGDDAVSGIELRSTTNGRRAQLTVTGVFVAIGQDPRTDLIRDALALTASGTIQVEGRSSRTSVSGVFAAGDVVDDTYRQAITAAASGTVAALDVERFLAELADNDASDAREELVVSAH